MRSEEPRRGRRLSAAAHTCRALALGLALAACGPPPALADERWAGDRTGLWYRGRVDLRAQYRTTGESDGGEREDDQDLVEDLFLEVGHARTARFEASGRLHEDIDGRPRVQTFRDLYDVQSGGEAFTGFLYTAYGELRPAGPIARVRAGRQVYGEGVDVRFDGGLIETEALGDAVRLAGYGGMPTYLYESSRTGDWLAGGAAEVVAIPRTRVRFDYVHVTDFRRDLERLEDQDGVERDTLRDDDYFQVSVLHSLAPEVRLRGLASTFEGRSSRVESEIVASTDRLGLWGRLRVTGQLGAYRDLSIGFTPLDEALGEYEPYAEVFAEVGKRFGKHVALSAGGAVRELLDDDDEGPFNHEFQRTFGRAELIEWPWQGLDLAVMGELYRSDLDDRTFQASFDAGQTIGPVRVGAGTSYSLYKFNEFFLEERERVRTYYGSLEVRPVAWLRPRLFYSFEEDDVDRYHVARIDVRITF